MNDDPHTFDFGKHWQKYWQQRIQVYYNESRQKITEEISANYRSTVFDADLSDESSSDETPKISRSTSTISSNCDVFDLTGGKTSLGLSNGT